MLESNTNYKQFKNALSRLEERYTDYLKEHTSLPRYLLESVKESCIRRFETCFDTSWKHLKKYLQEVEGIVEIAHSPNAVFKQAHASKIIDDVELWIEFNRKRIASTHDYSEVKAEETFAIIPDFIQEAIELYKKVSGVAYLKEAFEESSVMLRVKLLGTGK